jgi:hypothetical protein
MADQVTMSEAGATTTDATGTTRDGGTETRSQTQQRFASPRFYVCLAILVGCAVAIPLVAQVLEAHLRKLPIPLRRPLHQLDLQSLAPDYALHPIQPEPLSQIVLEALGTTHYLNWRLIDRRAAPSDPARMARLFITYYTGQPDPVPHHPRECLQAGGWTFVSEDSTTVHVPRSDGEVVDIPLAVLQFAPPRGGEQRLTVIYFFYANGQYMTGRNAVRLALSNLADRYAYYSKIEISFSSENGRRLADSQTSQVAAAHLLRRLMPVLWRDHYPDWEAIQRGQTPRGSTD